MIDSKIRGRRRFHLVMVACAGFVLLMLAALIYVCTRPQTAQVQAAERNAILKCRERSEDTSRSAIFRSSLVQACQEMEKQYIHKFDEKP